MTPLDDHLQHRWRSASGGSRSGRPPIRSWKGVWGVGEGEGWEAKQGTSSVHNQVVC